MKKKKRLLYIALVTVVLFNLSFAAIASAATKTGSNKHSAIVKFGDLPVPVEWLVNYSGEYFYEGNNQYKVRDHRIGGCISSLPYNYWPYCNASAHYKENGTIINTIGAGAWSNGSAMCPSPQHPYEYYKNNHNVYYSGSFYVDILTIIDTVGGNNNPYGAFIVTYQ